MVDSADAPPDHVDSVVRSIADIHSVHRQSTTSGQRALNRAAAAVSRPRFLALIVAAIVAWGILNFALAARGAPAFDPPPFAWLQGLIGFVSLCLVVLLVAAQRHEDHLARNRDLLELELAMVSEQKMAKVIELLEELRRDLPQVKDRFDEQAAAMAQTADHRRVLDTLAQSADPETE